MMQPCCAIHGATVENTLFEDGDAANTFCAFTPTMKDRHRIPGDFIPRFALAGSTEAVEKRIPGDRPTASCPPFHSFRDPVGRPSHFVILVALFMDQTS